MVSDLNKLSFSTCGGEAVEDATGSAKKPALETQLSASGCSLEDRYEPLAEQLFLVN